MLFSFLLDMRDFQSSKERPSFAPSPFDAPVIPRAPTAAPLAEQPLAPLLLLMPLPAACGMSAGKPCKADTDEEPAAPAAPAADVTWVYNHVVKAAAEAARAAGAAAVVKQELASDIKPEQHDLSEDVQKEAEQQATDRRRAV